MSSIVYKPHCSECGTVIDCCVSCEELCIPSHGDKLLRHLYEIQPWSCPRCGVLFDAIEVPSPESLIKDDGVLIEDDSFWHTCVQRGR